MKDELKKFIEHNKLISLFCVLSIVFILIFIFTNRMSEKFIFGYELMTLGYDVAIATIAAVIFYILQVYIPSKKNKKEIKNIF